MGSTEQSIKKMRKWFADGTGHDSVLMCMGPAFVRNDNPCKFLLFSETDFERAESLMQMDSKCRPSHNTVTSSPKITGKQ